MQLVLFQFTSQGAAIDTEATRRFRLIVLAMIHDRTEQGLFDFTQNLIVQVAGGFSIQILDIFDEYGFYCLLQVVVIDSQVDHPALHASGVYDRPPFVKQFMTTAFRIHWNQTAPNQQAWRNRLCCSRSKY